MSTATETRAAETSTAETSAAATSTAGPTRVFRGRSVAELIPTIQAELGPDAMVLGRRSGLEGGIGGFFQRPFVEIEAQAGGGSIDLYDGEEALPEPLLQEAAQALATPMRFSPAPSSFDALSFQTIATPAPTLATPEPPVAMPAPPVTVPEPPLSTPQATANDAVFADVLAAASSEPITVMRSAPEPAIQAPVAVAEPMPTPAATATPSLSRTALAVVRELEAIGFEEAFAQELIDAAGAHVLPFAPRIGLRKAVRTALARSIPSASPLPCAGATLALVGPGGSGKTKTVAGLAACYRRTGTLSVGCASISGEAGVEPLQMVFSPHITSPVQARSARALKAIVAASAGGLVLLDTPPVSPAERGAIKELAKLLGELSPDSIVIALPATLGAKAAAQLLQALRPLKAISVAITHADETDQLGVAVQVACGFGLAPEYLLSGARGARSLTRLDPTTLAERLLP
ncbi:MAG TPA: hypothetical protein VGF95_03130 [Solirubrobacteraceae bacterium]|jgi:flagellar biosynthesis GTPase FlhF